VGTVLLVALSVAFVYAVVNLAAFGHLNRVARFASYRVLEVLYLRRLEYDAPATPQRSASTAVPLAVPLALGLIIAPFVDLGGRLGGGL
jgi:hypothetical protein